MFWITMALFVLWGGFLMVNRRRRNYRSTEEEPWRASLESDAPLDIDEIRRAEEEWRADEEWHPDDEWRASSDDQEWR